MDRNNLMDGYR